MRDRYDEFAVRRLLRDTVALIDRVVESMAAGDPSPAETYAEAVPPAYRRRKVPMDDLITLCDSVHDAVASLLSTSDMGPVDEAIFRMKARFAWHRRIAGDARKRNRLLQAIYKGA